MAIGDPYITADDLADHLNMGAPVPAMELAVFAASRWIEGYCGRQFNLADVASDRLFDATSDGRVYVDDIGDPLVTVDADSSLDGTYGTSVADFQTGPLNAIATGEPIRYLVATASPFPKSRTRRGLVRVTAKWGWPAVPDDVKQAAVIQASKLYKRRESPEGVLGGGDFGLVRVGPRDRDVTDLLAPYRVILPGFA